MNIKRYKAIEKWLDNGNTNKEWEALLAVTGVSKWKYNSFSLSDIQAFVIMRGRKTKLMTN